MRVRFSAVLKVLLTASPLIFCLIFRSIENSGSFEKLSYEIPLYIKQIQRSSNDVFLRDACAVTRGAVCGSRCG